MYPSDYYYYINYDCFSFLHSEVKEWLDSVDNKPLMEEAFNQSSR